MEAELRDERAAVVSLVSGLAAGDEQLQQSMKCIDAAIEESSVLRTRLSTERRRRIVMCSRMALEQRASEARLLFLLQSQGHAINLTASELTDVRHAAAVSAQLPELEGVWLMPPPPISSPSDGSGDSVMAEPVMEGSERVSDGAKHRKDASEGWRDKWLAAMAHSM